MIDGKASKVLVKKTCLGWKKFGVCFCFVCVCVCCVVFVFLVHGSFDFCFFVRKRMSLSCCFFALKITRKFQDEIGF